LWTKIRDLVRAIEYGCELKCLSELTKGFAESHNMSETKSCFRELIVNTSRLTIVPVALVLKQEFTVKLCKPATHVTHTRNRIYSVINKGKW